MVKMHFCPFLGPFFDFLSGPERSILGVRTRFWWSKMPKSNFVSFGATIGVILGFPMFSWVLEPFFAFFGHFKLIWRFGLFWALPSVTNGPWRVSVR